jgi:hypothetical protein
VCSTTRYYVGYRTKAWYATMAGMLFMPPILATVAYIFAISPNVTSPIVSPAYSHFIPAATVLLYAYAEILIFCCGEHHFHHGSVYPQFTESDWAASIILPQFLALGQLISERHIYHRSHISRMRSDRMQSLIHHKPFTIFVLGISEVSIPIRECELHIHHLDTHFLC